MLYQFTRFFIIHRITAHNRTSRSKSADDDYGGHYRIAKTKLFQGVCFGYFLLYVVVEHHCRSPPERLEFYFLNSNRKERMIMEKLMGFCAISDIHSTYVWIQGDNSTGEWLMILKKFFKNIAIFAKCCILLMGESEIHPRKGVKK